MSLRVMSRSIEYPQAVVRWQPDAQGRLAEAAMSLYGEQGFDNTTVEQIAEQAGLTKRTFFRYFADKREVLFSGADELRELFVTAVAQAPAAATPLEAMAAALQAAAEMFEFRREFAWRRQQIIAGSSELRERELIKLQALAGAVAEALRARGVEDTAAVLTAEAGMAVFRVAFERWIEASDGEPFERVIERSLNELRLVTAG